MVPVRSYVICCVQRTGSRLLAHTLADTGYAGRPSDYFDQAERENHTREWDLPDARLTPYVRAVWNKATTPNGVLGSKMMWNDANGVLGFLSLPQLDADGLPPVRYRKQGDTLSELYVDLVRAAMSSPNARHTASG